MPPASGSTFSGDARPDTAPTTARIDLDHLRENLRHVRELAAPAEVMAVVKADAYGHGVEHVVPVLREEGVRHFAVATVGEGAELRELGVEGPILVLEAPLPEYLPAYTRHDLAVTVPSTEIARAVLERAERGESHRVHVNVDTGMGRIGLPPERTAGIVDRLRESERVRIEGVWSHYATAGEPESETVGRQFERFEAVIDGLPLDWNRTYTHIANSGALVSFPQYVSALPRPMVRVGITLYGYPPTAGLREPVAWKPVMQLSTRVLHVKTVEPGTPVSYYHTWKAPRRTRVATLGAGYADGYRRILSGRAEVRLGGRRVPVVGTVCMDMIMVDLGPPGRAERVAIGDHAVLFGPSAPTAEDLADWADTIPYEILSGVSARVPRRAVRSEHPERAIDVSEGGLPSE